jgi:alkanesulfonate monooxygenase SsuD/methylene tetrahydromethanopterin reductase-like flavin-dependent oxidoreductase (luciferase family)
MESELEPRAAATWPLHPWVAEGASRVRLGVYGGEPAGDWAGLLAWVRTVEALGFDSFWVNDHTINSWRDCWTGLMALAAGTERLRLGSLVSCVYYRSPALLARMAADVDRLSGGRLVLGVGAGDDRLEFSKLGLASPPLRARQAALQETVEIVRGLWQGAPFTLAGEHFQVVDAEIRPGPVQRPHVPLLLAGGGERVTLRQVAEYADACNFGPSGATGSAWGFADVQRKYAALAAHCARIGRPYESVLRTFYCPLVLGETAAEVQVRLDARAGGPPMSDGPHAPGLPREIHTFFNVPGPERIPLLVLAGTPAEVSAYFRGLVAAGVQYLIVTGVDAQNITLLADIVATVGAA